MKRLFTLVMLGGYMSAVAFNVHLYKDGASEHYNSVANASKIEFSKENTVVSDDWGTVVSVDNKEFSFFKFSASSGVADVAVAGNPSLFFDGNKIIVDAEKVTSIEVLSINGGVVLKTTTGNNTCDISALSCGTYIVRAVADGKVIVNKFYKNL